MKKLQNLPLLALSLLFLTACEVGQAEIDLKTILLEGTVENSTGVAVRNAEVQILKNGSIIRTLRTDEEGRFLAAEVSPDNYEILITANGYNETLDTLDLTISQSDIVSNYTLLGEANINGTILNSQTGGSLANAEVSFYTQELEGQGRVNTDTSQANADLVVMTAEDGSYKIENAPIGNFVCVVRGEGFMPRVIQDVQLNTGENTQEGLVLVETVQTGELRIILTWGADPKDLDAHLTGPITDSEERFHLYYDNPQITDDIAQLDVDDTDGNGPETVTLKSLVAGMYRFSVYNYSNPSTTGVTEIQDSPTQIEIYDEEGLLMTLTASNQKDNEGNLWRAFEILVDDKGNYEIQNIDEYLLIDTDSNADNFRTNGKPTIWNVMGL